MKEMTSRIRLIAVAGVLVAVVGTWQHFVETGKVDDLDGELSTRSQGVGPGPIDSDGQAAFVAGAVVERNLGNASFNERLAGLKGLEKPSPTDVLSDFYIVIRGNISFSRAEILDNLDVPEKATYPLLKKLIKEHVVNFYRTHGFADMFVEDVRVITSNPTTLEVTLGEGDSYRLDRIEFHGLGGLTESEAVQFYSREGEAFDWVQLSDSDRELQAHYRRKGYLDAEVHAQVVPCSGRRGLCYRVMIDEGPLYRVGSVSKDLEVMAGFPLERGEVFSSSLLNEFLKGQELQVEDVRLIKDRERSSVDLDLRIDFVTEEVGRARFGSGEGVL